MRVLVACERSGVIRRAFWRRGICAWSVDLEQAEDRAANHYQMDAVYCARTYGPWDIIIAHPECRRLCNSGVLRLYVGGKKANGIDADKWREMEEAAKFYEEMAGLPSERICVENSVMHGYARELTEISVFGWGKQIIQPHQFGDDASKATLLRLKNLPRLIPTKQIPPRMVDGKPRWANQTDSGQNKLAPSANRSAQRARTYEGIALAMAEQWGK